MIVEVFTNGDLIFWILMIVANIFLFAAAASEETWGAGLTAMVIVLLLLLLFSDVGPAVAGYPGTVAVWIAGYLAIGFAGTIPRWFMRLYGLGLYYRKRMWEFLVVHGADEPSVPKSLWSEWSRRVFEDERLRDMHVRFDAEDGTLEVPTVRNNADLLLVWWLLWPWSWLWFAFGEQFLEIWRAVMRKLRALYDALARWAFNE